MKTVEIFTALRSNPVALDMLAEHMGEEVIRVLAQEEIDDIDSADGEDWSAIGHRVIDTLLAYPLDRDS